MRALALVTGLTAACSTAQTVGGPDGGLDAAAVDAAGLDAADASRDAGPVDAGGDGPGACAIVGATPVVLDGDGDLAAYPAAQVVPLGAPADATDELRVSWSPAGLTATLRSAAFADPAHPLHLYVEAAVALPAAMAGAGKEYGGLIPAVPFTATHLIAVRPQDDFGTGAYDGVYLPGAGGDFVERATPLAPGVEVFRSVDGTTLSVRVPWAALGGCPHALRLAAHVVNGAVANEWKDVAPAGHTPWQAPGGAAYTLDLTGPADVAGWTP